jgi:hypothetical protein
MAQSALIRLEREEALNSSLSKFKIVVDGKQVGTIANGDVVEIHVDPGRHTLRLRISWTGSPSVPFSLDQGETVHFVCRPAFTNSMLAFWFVFQSFFKHDNWIDLEVVP